jgi:hypothetical protein
MDETFTLDVSFRGEDLEFEGKLLVTGYQHKIEMDVNGTPVFFEPDEERNYRALVGPEQIDGRHLSVELLQAIARRLESLLKS